MDEDEKYEASLVDLSDAGPWLNPDMEAALNNLLEILWNEGISTQGTTITLPELPGRELTLATDFGVVHIKEQE